MICHDTVKYEILENRVPENERYHVINDWEEGIQDGIVQAIPIADSQFEYSYIALNNRPKKGKIEDEVVLLTPEFETWLEDKKHKTRKELMTRTGKIYTNNPNSESDDNLEELLRLRREHLGNRNKAKTKRK